MSSKAQLLQVRWAMKSMLPIAACLVAVLPACGPPNPVQDPTNPPEIAPSDTKPGTGMDLTARFLYDGGGDTTAGDRRSFIGSETPWPRDRQEQPQGAEEAVARPERRLALAPQPRWVAE